MSSTDGAEAAALLGNKSTLGSLTNETERSWRDRFSSRIYGMFFITQVKTSQLFVPAWVVVLAGVIETIQLVSLCFAPVFHWNVAVGGIVFDIVGVLSAMSLHIYTSNIIYWIAMALVLMLVLSLTALALIGSAIQNTKFFYVLRVYTALIATVFFIPLLVMSVSAMLCEVGLSGAYVHEGPSSGYCWHLGASSVDSGLGTHRFGHGPDSGSGSASVSVSVLVPVPTPVPSPAPD